ncbi:uncharacterized protein MELLADRAFT_84901 [Melampsora larici-populina 98AG31]|uniref:Uncharacterized protein n=1 Tax=Melampsora larici-populina (strain 98AG31 / pathotype 3-4-7) TaxID=747676 RepID=F4RH66_MELLP|nr:uncharacterized protein MELLADRAFT_84901 [Melampsora larici-populina 98AG31]EGG08384.1 hypothetical protein MELLADRAFT_84901 [Melampsora larici-populina 98AG31]
MSQFKYASSVVSSDCDNEPQTTPNTVDLMSTPPVKNTPATSLKKAKHKKSKKQGKKFKTPVPASGKLATFIDHGSICNSEGYSIYPNGETVFVRQPDQEVTNFGLVAYRHTQKTCVAKDGSGAWKTIWHSCLGVLECDNNDCDYAAPPPTAKGKAAQLVLE